MKLLLATGIYPPDIGGPATYAVLLKEELPKRGIKVEIVTYGPSGVSRNWPKGLRHFFYFISCLKSAFNSDLILAQDTVSAGLPALLASKISRKKLFVRVPGDYVWEQSVQRFGVKDTIDDFQNKKYGWRVELLRSVQKFVVNGAHTVITPSRYFQRLVAGWVKKPAKVRVIYNGVRLGVFGPKMAARSKILTSAGRLVPWKGFAFLIELMRDLPGWRLIIMGDGPERENLKSQILDLKLESRVELTGLIPREKVLELLSQSDIFVLNTTFESFSFQIVEAMSLALPVVSTNIGNLSEIIESGVDGILVEPDNKSQFLEAINKIDKDEKFRKSISEKAKIKAEKFSINNTVNELVKLMS